MSNPNPMRCRCNTADIAFPVRGQESNPNPMNSRCGLEDCDCGYTIERLVKALEWYANPVVHQWGPAGREPDIIFDKGNRARKAIQAAKP